MLLTFIDNKHISEDCEILVNNIEKDIQAWKIEEDYLLNLFVATYFWLITVNESGCWLTKEYEWSFEDKYIVIYINSKSKYIFANYNDLILYKDKNPPFFFVKINDEVLTKIMNDFK